MRDAVIICLPARTEGLMLLHHVGRIKAFFLEADRSGAATVANQAQRRRKTYGHLSHEGCQAVRENRSKKETVRLLLFFILLLTSAVKIRWMENGGHESDNGFIIKSHTLFKQPLHSADSKRQQGIDCSRPLEKK